LVPGRRLAGVHNKLDDRVLAGAREPRDRADGGTLAQEMEDAGAGFTVELVHGSTYMTLSAYRQEKRVHNRNFTSLKDVSKIGLAQCAIGVRRALVREPDVGDRRGDRMPSDNWPDLPPSGLSSDEVAFDYIKSPNFHIVWADGLIGGVTPTKHIHFALYGERPAIPRRQVFKVDTTTGVLGAPVVEKMISRNSIVRELSCDVVISPDVAEMVAKWLLDRVNEIKEIERRGGKP
jgi:hypothetical protein